jgi:signal transduction histidine kinase
MNTKPSPTRRTPSVLADTLVYMAEVRRALSQTIDLQSSCEATASLLAPRWADGCAIDLSVDGGWRRMTAWHRSSTKMRELHNLGVEPYPGDLPAALAEFLEAGVPHCFKASRSIADSLSVTGEADLIHRLLGSLFAQGCEATVYPLVVNDRAFGLVTLVCESATGTQATQASEILSAVLQYASVVMDSCRLYAQAQAARTEAHRAQVRFDVLAAARQNLCAAPTLTEALKETARIATTHLGTCCIIDFTGLCPSDRNMVLSHVDPNMESQLQNILLANPEILPSFTQGQGAQHTLLETMVGGVQHLRLPVCVRDTLCGQATFIRSHNANTPFDAHDRKFAHELLVCLAQTTDRRWLNAELEIAVQTRDEFLCIASHELRTPLTALELHLGNLARLAGRPDPDLWQPRMQEKLKSASRQTGRLTQIIDNLLDVANIRTGRLDLAPVPMQVYRFCADIVDQWAEVAHTAGCALILECAERLTSFWDAYRMEQVLAHLLANAIKYGAGKPITLSVSDNEDAIIIRVRDHGIGVAHQAAERIFDQYERAVSPREFGGLGLGLFICREIIEAHGGHIYMRNRDDGGAEFEIAMPKAPRAPLTTPGEGRPMVACVSTAEA